MPTLRPVTLALSASFMFGASLFGFAALRPTYAHLTDAVSELGAWGAPNMWAFNVLGFMAPGVLLGACGWRLAQQALPASRIVAALLAYAGLGLTFAGLSPADMRDYGSITTIGHLVGSIGSVLAWAIGAAWLAFACRKTRPALAIVSIIALALMIAAFVLYETIPPGSVQRLTFAIFFGWWIAAAALMRQSRAPSALQTAARESAGALPPSAARARF